MKPDGSLPKSMNWHLPNTVTISGPLGIGKNSSLYLPGGPLWVWESKTRPTIFWVHLFMSRAVRWWRMLLQWALVGFLLQCAPDEQLRWVGSWHWWLSSYLRHLSDKFPSWLRAIEFFICLFEWRTKWRDWPGSGMKWRHWRLLENGSPWDQRSLQNQQMKQFSGDWEGERELHNRKRCSSLLELSVLGHFCARSFQRLL